MRGINENLVTMVSDVKLLIEHSKRKIAKKNRRGESMFLFFLACKNTESQSWAFRASIYQGR
jgi:hypothetical protein